MKTPVHFSLLRMASSGLSVHLCSKVSWFLLNKLLLKMSLCLYKSQRRKCHKLTFEDSLSYNLISGNNYKLNPGNIPEVGLGRQCVIYLFLWSPLKVLAIITGSKNISLYFLTEVFSLSYLLCIYIRGVLKEVNIFSIYCDFPHLERKLKQTLVVHLPS